MKSFQIKKTALCLALMGFGSAALAASGTVSGWVVYWDMENSIAAVRDHGSKFEEISVFAADFDENLQLAVYPAALQALQELKELSLSPRPRLLISIVNDVRTRSGSLLKNPDCIHEILTSNKKRSAHIEQLLHITEGLDGIEIDYESLYPKDRAAFSAFIRELATRLHQRGQWLAIDVGPDKDGAMDWKVLGQYADQIKVMAYLYHYPSGDAGPLAPPDWVEEIARSALKLIPPEKLSIALTMNGCDWGSDGRAKSLNHSKIAALTEKYRPVLERDPASDSPYFPYDDKETTHQVWFEDARSLKEKTKRLKAAGIGHIALWYLGSGDPKFLSDLK